MSIGTPIFMPDHDKREGEDRMGEVKDMSIRLLRADEIECRIATINERGLSLLLFKDARVDQKILDEAFTPFGWKRSHQMIDGNLYCTVEVWDDGKGQWIGKQDVGTMSYTEKEKGQASDSFKRACFNWGLGRELYTAPFIWVSAGTVDIQEKVKDGKRQYHTHDRFRVQAIAYDRERSIKALSIVNARGQEVYRMGIQGGSQETPVAAGTPASTRGEPTGRAAGVTDKDAQAAGVGRSTDEDMGIPGQPGQPAAQERGDTAQGKEMAGKAVPVRQGATGISLEQRAAMEQELTRTGVALVEVLQRYGLQSAEQMGQEVYGKAMRSLKRSKSRGAA